MMQLSYNCSDAEDRESMQRFKIVGDVVEGDFRQSIDGSSTLVSNLSSDEDHSLKSKSNNIRTNAVRRKLQWTSSNRIWIIFLTFVLGFSILGLGYWVGWIIGERREAQNLTNIGIDSPIGNPASMPSLAPKTSPDGASKDDHHTVSVSSTIAPSYSQIKSVVEQATKPPKGSLNVEPPSKSPTYPSMVPGNNIEPETKFPSGSSTTPMTTPVSAPSISPGNLSGNQQHETASINEITYIPGNLTRFQNDLLLSEGLAARIIARTGKPVMYVDGSSSDVNFHILPDAGASFPDTRWWNRGGWIYVSNSEAKNESEGGVGAITFDKYGSVVHYRMVLENTQMNCGGGRTPWNTWVSCEEVEFTGQIYQVDPTGQRPSQRMTLGHKGGRWESFAYDIRNRNKPRFFSTEDHNKGCTRRFTPAVTHWGGDEWRMLHEEGVIDFLYVHPNEERTGGTFEWTNDMEAAKNNARTFYPQSEGIDIQDGKMYIVCKKIRQLFVFDLDQMTFHNVSTASGLFDGDPDQLQRILGSEGGLLYFTEEGGENAGVHARDEFGRFFTILESPFLADETTGLSFSPDGKHMYIAYQENGILFDVTREDGLAFDAKSLDVKYHNSISSRRLNSQWIGI